MPVGFLESTGPERTDRLRTCGQQSVPGGPGLLRRQLVQLAAVLAGRDVEPAAAGAEKAALVREAEHIGGLRQRQVQPAEVLLRKLAPRVIQKLHEGCGFLLEAALKRAFADGELACDLIALRFAIGQSTDDHFPRAIAGPRVVEAPQIFPGKT